MKKRFSNDIKKDIVLDIVKLSYYQNHNNKGQYEAILRKLFKKMILYKNQ